MHLVGSRHVEDNGDDDKPTYPYIYELMEMVEIS